jgi:hypothetical protein
MEHRYRDHAEKKGESSFLFAKILIGTRIVDSFDLHNRMAFSATAPRLRTPPEALNRQRSTSMFVSGLSSDGGVTTARTSEPLWLRNFSIDWG